MRGSVLRQFVQLPERTDPIYFANDITAAAIFAEHWESRKLTNIQELWLACLVEAIRALDLGDIEALAWVKGTYDKQLRAEGKGAFQDVIEWIGLQHGARWWRRKLIERWNVRGRFLAPWRARAKGTSVRLDVNRTTTRRLRRRIRWGGRIL